MRARDIARGVGRAVLTLVASIAVVVTFVVSLVLGLVLHLDTAVARRLIGDTVTELVSTSIRGRLVISEIEEISWGRIEGVAATAIHPSGRRVIEARGVNGRFDAFELVDHLLTTKTVMVPWAELTSASVDLGGDGWETLAIAETFESTSPPTASSQSIDLVLGEVVLHDVLVSGRDGPLTFDARVSDVRGSLHVGESVTIDVARADILTEGAPRGLDLDGTAAVNIAIGDEDVDLGGRFDGRVGPAPVTLSGNFGDTLEVRLKLGPVSGEEIQRFVPGIALRDDVTVTLEAEGPVTDVALDLEVAAGSAGRMSFDGQGRLEPSPKSPELAGRLALGGIDLARVLPDAPRTALDGRGRLRLDTTAPMTATLHLETERGSVGGYDVPPLSLDARYTDDGVHVTVEADGPGAALVVDAKATLGEPIVVEGSADVERLDLALLPLAGPAISGTLAGTVDGRVELGEGSPRIDADVWLVVHQPRIADAGARRLQLRGRASGPIDGLRIDATATAHHLEALGRRFEEARLRAHGSLSALRTDLSLRGGEGAITRAHAEALVRVACHVVRLESPQVELTRRGHRLSASADEITLTPRLAIDGLNVDAPGLDASAAIAPLPDGWSVTLESDDVDVAQLGRALGLDLPLGGKTKLSVDADLRLTGRVLEPRSLVEATGRIELTAEADLHEVRSLLAPHVELPPLPHIDGDVTVALTVERAPGELAPDVALDVNVDDVIVQPRGQFTRALDGAVWPADVTVTGVDLGLEASVDAGTQLTDLELRIRDTEGELVAFDGDVEVPWHETWRALSRGLAPRLPSQWWRAATMRFWGHIPRRRLQSLPGFDDSGIAAGDVRLVVSGRGSVDDPELDVVLRSFGASSSSLPIDDPIDLVVVGSLDRDQADARIKLFAPDRQMAVSHVRFGGSATRALLDGDDDWRLDAHAQLCDLPMKTLAPLQEFLVRGRANGHVEIVGLNTDQPAIDADLRVADLRIGEARYRELVVRGQSDPKRTVVDARVEQTDGHLALHATLPIEWRGVLPSPIRGQATQMELVAERFDVRALQPFLEGSVNELSGRLDGRLEGELSSNPTLRGQLSWSDGRLQLVSINTRLSNIEAKVKTERDGRLVLESLRAESMNGRVQASGYADMDGLTLQRAHLGLEIPEDRPIAVVVEGQSYGRASVSATADLRPFREGYRADVKVSRVHVELPRTFGSGAVALESAEFIRFGTKQDETFVPLRLSPPVEESSGTSVPWLVDLELADVELERQDLSVYLNGHPQIELADEMRMRGQIRIFGGRLDVQGRTFDIEEGTIDFDNRPPDDPIVNVTASWQGPEGTTIYAKYVGPVSTGEVQLSSDPPRPKSELLALLLFGDANHQIGGGNDGGAAGQAVGLGGSVLAKGLNAALDDLVDLDLAARVDTTSSSNPEAELEWRVARQFSLGISHVLGIPEPGESPDRNYAGIEWRFAHEWTLETTVGDQGSTSFDVLWQHSY